MFQAWTGNLRTAGAPEHPIVEIDRGRPPRPRGTPKSVMNSPSVEYVICCPTCASEHDAGQAIWCSCDPQDPTKLCPFCLTCFCDAKQSFRDGFWDQAPSSLLEERSALKESRMLLGDMLVRAGVITTTQLLEALKFQKKEERLRLGDALVVLGYLTKDQIDDFVKLQHSVVDFDISGIFLDLGLIRQVGVEFCRRKQCLPLERESFKSRTLLTLAMAGPADSDTIYQVQRMSGGQVVAVRAPAEEILGALGKEFPEDAAPAAPTI